MSTMTFPFRSQHAKNTRTGTHTFLSDSSLRASKQIQASPYHTLFNKLCTRLQPSDTWVRLTKPPIQNITNQQQTDKSTTPITIRFIRRFVTPIHSRHAVGFCWNPSSPGQWGALETCTNRVTVRTYRCRPTTSPSVFDLFWGAHIRHHRQPISAIHRCRRPPSSTLRPQHHQTGPILGDSARLAQGLACPLACQDLAGSAVRFRCRFFFRSGCHNPLLVHQRRRQLSDLFRAPRSSATA